MAIKTFGVYSPWGRLGGSGWRGSGLSFGVGLAHSRGVGWWRVGFDGGRIDCLSILSYPKGRG